MLAPRPSRGHVKGVLTMAMTVNGVSTTKALGQEQYKKFSVFLGRVRRTNYQYDYRHTNGKLFSCVKPTLKACRAERDKWLAEQ